MIKNLHEGLIAEASRILGKKCVPDEHIIGKELDIGISRDINIPGKELDFGILYHANTRLDESVGDWIRICNVKNPHDHQWLHESHFNSLSKEEIDTVKNYTFNSDDINNEVRKRIISKTPITGKIHANGSEFSFDTFNSALTKNNLPTDFITYSGVSKIPESDISSDTGHVHSKKFISSSVDPTVAYQFSDKHDPDDGFNHILKIHHYKGQTGLYIGHNPELTHTPLEFEFIMPHDARFRLNYHPEEITNKSGKVTHKVWSVYRLK